MFVPLCKQYGNQIVSTPLHIHPPPHHVDCGRRAQGSASAFRWRFEKGLCETLHPNFNRWRSSLFGGIIYPRSCEKCPKTHLPCTAFEGISGLTSVVTTVTLRPFFT